jgi:hypothetical protein
VTLEVTEGQWPKTLADMEKCATTVTKFKQFNFFVPPTDALKPPSTAASNRIDLNDAKTYNEDPRLFGPPGVVVTSKRPPDPGVIESFKWPPGEWSRFLVASGPGLGQGLQVTSGPGCGREHQVASGPGRSRDLQVASGPGRGRGLQVVSGPGCGRNFRVGLRPGLLPRGVSSQPAR